MDEFVVWLRAQLDEDERLAEGATPGPWWHNPGKQWLGPEAFEKYDLRQGEEFVGYGGPHPFTGAVCATGPASDPQGMRDAAFIAEWDPARALREIDARRQRIAIHAGPHECASYDSVSKEINPCQWVDEGEACTTLRLEGVPYEKRPGYRDSWRP
jgi:hypothetical protein